MLKYLIIFCHVLLVSLFIYLQVQGASILGSDDEKPQPSAQHGISHK